MSFTSGMQALQDAIEAGKKRAEAAQSGGGKYLGYINWKAGEKKIVRFLTDDLITEEMYDFIVNNQGKTSNFLVDPTDRDRLKRYMSPTPGIGWRKSFATGALEEPKPTVKGMCVAVVRREVPAAGGKMQIEDFLYDKEIDGQTYPARTFGVVIQGVNNFWHTLATSCFSRYGSICTLDYEITRSGDGRDTKYSILPLPEIPELNTIEAVQDFYFYGKGAWDVPEGDEEAKKRLLSDNTRFLKCPMTIHQWAADYCSEERHKYYLAPKDGQDGMGEFAQGTTHNDEAQAMQTSGTAFASLQDTLLKHAPK